MKLNVVLIQNNKSVFFVFSSKIATYSRLECCCSAQAIEKNFWQLFNLKKACFFYFAIVRCCKNRKKAFTKTDRAIEIKKSYKHGR